MKRQLIAAATLIALSVAGCSQRTSQPARSAPPQPTETDTAAPPPVAATPKAPASAPRPQTRQRRTATTPPTSPNSNPTPSPADANRNQTPTPAPVAQPSEELKTPRYVKVLEVESLAAEPALSVSLDPPMRVALQTRDIKRLAITRIGLPLDRRGKSIALKIDGQIFEWQGRHITVVFEHSPNGGWQVVDRVAIEP